MENTRKRSRALGFLMAVCVATGTVTLGSMAVSAQEPAPVKFAAIKVGDVYSAGTQLELAKHENCTGANGQVQYWTDENTFITQEAKNCSGLVTLPNSSDKWEVFIASDNGANGNPCCLVRVKKVIVYAVSSDVTGLTGATAVLSKDSAKPDGAVTVTIAPETGKCFAAAPTVTADNAAAGSVLLGENGVYTCEVTGFTADTVLTVAGEAKAHIAGEWILDQAATTAAQGRQHKECVSCGEVMETGTIPMLPTYTFTQGVDSGWKTSSKEGLTFKLNGEMEKCTAVKINGTVLGKENYALAAGSTIVTLKPEYLGTLKAGNYELTVVFTDGEAKAGFTVTAIDKAPDTADSSTAMDKTPDTADSSAASLPFGMLVLSGAAVAVLAVKKKGNCKQ